MKKWQLILGTCLLLLFPFLFNVALLWWSTPITFGKSDSWIGFFASYFGAIFGGLIGGLFTFLGVKQSIHSETTRKFIDEFPDKIQTVYKIIETMNNRKNSTQHKEFLSGNSIYSSSSSVNFFREVEGIIDSVFEKGIRVDGALYTRMKNYKLGTTHYLNKYLTHPKIDEYSADDEYGTNARMSSDCRTLRQEAIKELDEMYAEIQLTFRLQQLKMEEKFKTYVKKHE